MSAPSPLSPLPSSKDDVLVRVEGVSKKFCRSLKKSLWYGMKDIVHEINPFGMIKAERREQREEGADAPLSSLPSPLSAPAGALRPGEFWAVNDVSFELRRGECLGLIGRNGAGKTTLLKMLNGLIKPDKGRIEMRGRVGALIALGAGFNPILTGRENIYVNASVLGLSKREIDAKLDEIIEFAEIGEFIDTPVQSYSSGMQVRLGFAIATALDPDVLLLDEVLAVGDAPFRNKCYNRIGSLRQRAATIFVSHTMDQVCQVCDRGLVLARGRMEFLGEVTAAAGVYDRLNQEAAPEDGTAFESIIPPINSIQFHLGNRVVRYGENLDFKMEVNTSRRVDDAILRVVFYDGQERPFAEWNSNRNGIHLSLNPGRNVLAVKIGPLLLKSGNYKLGINLNDETGASMLCWSYKKHEITVDSFCTVGPNVAFQSPLTRLE